MLALAGRERVQKQVEEGERRSVEGGGGWNDSQGSRLRMAIHTIKVTVNRKLGH